MVTGYNFEINEDDNRFDEYIKKGEEQLAKYRVGVNKNLEEYVINGVADGTKIEKEWFPEMDADIFISHSHADENLAKGIAGWLYETFGLHCFIDSCVWGYSDHLLELINDKYSEKKEDTNGGWIYNHRKCNTASKHVSTMLNIALQRMIDKTEITIVLNTNNSISKYVDIYKNSTYSPWIYSEVLCTQIVKRKSIGDYRDSEELRHVNESARFDNEGFGAFYELKLEHLKTLDVDLLCKWKRKYEKHKIEYPLDYLYELTYEEIKKEDLIEMTE